jgi:hypothetical protein
LSPPTPNPYLRVPTPMWWFGDGVFGTLGYEDGASRWDLYIDEKGRVWCLSLYCVKIEEGRYLLTRERAFAVNLTCWPSDLRLVVFRTMRNTC